jgi:hypothetical protein
MIPFKSDDSQHTDVSSDVTGKRVKQKGAEVLMNEFLHAH